FFFSSRRRHTRFSRDWSSDVCSSDLGSAADQIYHGVMDHGANDKSPVRSMGKAPGPVPRLSLPGGRSVISQGHAPPVTDPLRMRSEERRVGQECKSRRVTYAENDI